MNEIIIYIMTFFMVLGAVDKLIGNKFGLGQKFTEAFWNMGMLALSMIGIISLSPVIAKVLAPIVTPVYEFLGADPSMFASTLLALDMGGYALSKEMSMTADAALFSWVFLGTMMGPTIVFTIPVALSIIKKEDHGLFAKGILIGLVTIPIGCLIGGWFAGFEIGWMIKNLIPSLIISALIGFGIMKFPKQVITGFKYFAKAIECLIIVGLAISIIQTLTGIVLIKGLLPISEGFLTVGSITIILAGAFPLVYVLQKVLHKPFKKIGKILQVNQHSLVGFVSTFAHNLPMFAIFTEMDNRGKVVNTAFAVSGAFVFGSHLGFVAAIEKDLVIPMIIGKLVAGFLAVILAIIVTKNEIDK